MHEFASIAFHATIIFNKEGVNNPQSFVPHGKNSP